MDSPMEKNIQPKILVVDDNATNVLLLKEMLRIHDYLDVQSTTDPREVVKMYREYRPDLVLLDLRMPYMSGFEVMQELKYVEEDFLTVIMITAQSDSENKLKALELGVRDFIGKPFDTNEVMMRIKNILEYKFMQNQLKEYNDTLEKKVKESIKDLEEMQVELIQRLLRAAESRDDSTGNHIIRIGLYAYEMGKMLGLSTTDCELLKYASMMHDIGKIGIPDQILLKPGKLNPDEWEIMKEHSKKGAKILAGSNSKVIQLAEVVAHSHHEKWDGSGYPDGLKGEEIPIESRITAICDFFDALLSKRPYKEAWELDRVVEEIKINRGSHFDPSIADIFLENLDRFVKIKKEYDS